MKTKLKPFKIQFEDQLFEDLHKRIALTRMPKAFDANWTFGTDCDYLQDLLKYWVDEYDWKQKENDLNQYEQYLCDIEDMTIHFFHIKSKKENATPILLAHGWPDSFLRYAKVFSLLSDYDLVIPSLPGFAFSTLPEKGFVNNAEIAEICHKLMTDLLGYNQYVTSGGDVGRGVVCYLATLYPNEVKGLHLTDVGLIKELIGGADDTLSPAELDYKQRATKWLQLEGAYINIHSTKPQTLSYALSDSPTAMAAWIVEKYKAWSDWELLSKDDILDCLTLYWMTNSACTSVRVYHGNSYTLPPLGKVSVPTAILAFPQDVLPPPREWVEKNYPVEIYNEMPRGGHFTALEQPQLFAENLSQFIENYLLK